MTAGRAAKAALFLALLALHPLHGAALEARREAALAGGDASPMPGGPLVRQVRLELPPGEEAGGLAELLEVKAGDRLSPRAVRRSVERLYGTGRFANVVARERAVPGAAGEVALVFACQQKELVAAVEVGVRGERPAVEDEELLRASGLAAGSELWPGRLEAAAERMRALLARRGWRAARVRAGAAPTAPPEGGLRVTFTVEAGPPLVVEALILVPRPWAAPAAAGRSAGPLAAPGLPAGIGEGLATRAGAVLDLEALEADLRTLTERLRRAGHLRARLGRPEIRAHGRCSGRLAPGAGAHRRGTGAAREVSIPGCRRCAHGARAAARAGARG